MTSKLCRNDEKTTKKLTSFDRDSVIFLSFSRHSQRKFMFHLRISIISVYFFRNYTTTRKRRTKPIPFPPVLLYLSPLSSSLSPSPRLSLLSLSLFVFHLLQPPFLPLLFLPLPFLIFLFFPLLITVPPSPLPFSLTLFHLIFHSLRLLNPSPPFPSFSFTPVSLLSSLPLSLSPFLSLLSPPSFCPLPLSASLPQSLALTFFLPAARSSPPLSLTVLSPSAFVISVTPATIYRH